MFHAGRGDPRGLVHAGNDGSAPSDLAGPIDVPLLTGIALVGAVGLAIPVYTLDSLVGPDARPTGPMPEPAATRLVASDHQTTWGGVSALSCQPQTHRRDHITRFPRRGRQPCHNHRCARGRAVQGCDRRHIARSPDAADVDGADHADRAAGG
ncbi:DUF5368 family protein [Roseobacter sinensis]|uniref:DUF5368 family protein n=1 Tax=Roseobacter sinensis TaxID=2931391 RepID=UPI00384F4453